MSFFSRNRNKLIASKEMPLCDANHDPVTLFLQFFLPSTPARLSEIQFCLKQNVDNPMITTIYLLGERSYHNDELGVSSNKIKQVVLGRRLTYYDVFQYIAFCEEMELPILGYHILLNADIFMDETSISNLKQTTLHSHRSAGALLRWEYFATDPAKSQIFGPRFDSQDAWIFHSNFPVFMPDTSEPVKRSFDFALGRPGCDNRVAWLLDKIGYTLYNDPLFIKTYHVHQSKKRSYGNADMVKGPWLGILPARIDPHKMHVSLGISSFIDKDGKTIQFFEANRMYPPKKSGSVMNFII
jgi:hypothetical protein